MANLPLLGPGTTVMGRGVPADLMVAGVFQANANVAGVTAFAPESVVLTAAFVAVSVVVLPPGRRLRSGA